MKIKHKKLINLIEKNKINLNNYKINEIFKILKKINYVNFDSSIDIYINLIIKNKNDFIINKIFNLPYSNGKKYIILALVPKIMRNKIKKLNINYIGGNKYIEKIKNEKWTKFDILITTSIYMKKLLNLGKILGSKNLMPNLNNNTITENPYEKIKEIIESKKINININNKTNIINITIGKISFNENKLMKNLKYILNEINILKKKYNYLIIKNLYISSTMSPSLKLII
ncbi:MAG: 50S ribosomal protein L1 [Candidatus Shikimatogenerans bostrichidophilus]|nr:MAG: 50S ribosomal protein L1 [Candidatus Shikimatogenerans bostrichidophilus]